MGLTFNLEKICKMSRVLTPIETDRVGGWGMEGGWEGFNPFVEFVDEVIESWQIDWFDWNLIG